MATNQDLTHVPPHSLEAERSTLGALLIDKDSIIKIADLINADDFYHEKHASIYRTVIELFEKRQPIDVLTVTSLLEDKKELDLIGGASYIAELTSEVPTASHIFQYGTIVKQKAILRKLLKAGDTITGLGYKETDEIENLLEEAEKALFNVSQTFIQDRFGSFSL